MEKITDLLGLLLKELQAKKFSPDTHLRILNHIAQLNKKDKALKQATKIVKTDETEEEILKAILEITD